MKTKKYAALAFLSAGLAFHSCSVSYGAMGEEIVNRLENDRQILSAAGQCLREGKQEGEFYITGRNYMPEGTILKNFYGDLLEYSSTLEQSSKEGADICHKVRFAVKWQEEEKETATKPKQEGEEKQHWNLGDTIARELGGITYTFRCIDQNYQNGSASETIAALFLCDSVIPADMGSFYEYEKQEDGSYQYVFHPGPIINFGASGEYKYSKIRQWLKSQEGQTASAVWADIGISRNYMGQTEEGSYSQLQEKALRSHYIGNQQMTDQLFILSVEEALKYKEYLWRFGVMPQDGAKENPESQYSPFKKGYWLRTPMGNGSGEDTKKVYIVDLINGNIHPQSIQLEESSNKHGFYEQEEEWANTSSIGIRPAFALMQKG